MSKITTEELATSLKDQLMTSAEKTKLAGIATGANNYTHPTGAGNNHIPAAGAAGNYLKYSAAGTATWATPTKADVGLGSVENYGIATQAEAEAGTSDAKYMTPLKVSQFINNKGFASTPDYVAGTTYSIYFFDSYQAFIDRKFFATDSYSSSNITFTGTNMKTFYQVYVNISGKVRMSFTSRVLDDNDSDVSYSMNVKVGSTSFLSKTNIYGAISNTVDLTVKKGDLVTINVGMPSTNAGTKSISFSNITFKCASPVPAVTDMALIL